MLDKKYEREDLGFTFTVSPLGEIVTDPGFKFGEWFVKHSDAEGVFIIPLDEELHYFAGGDPLWNQPAKAVFNQLETVVMIFKLGTVESERHIMTLLHRSVAHAYTEIADK
jgi:hypothetical protein